MSMVVNKKRQILEINSVYVFIFGSLFHYYTILQDVIDTITKCGSYFLTKCDSFITKCNSFVTICAVYYKMCWYFAFEKSLNVKRKFKYCNVNIFQLINFCNCTILNYFYSPIYLARFSNCKPKFH